MTLETVSFEGHDCVRLEDGDVALVVTISTGPRILGLLVEGENLFAVLPDATLDGPDGERFRFLGGHRLWVAPEVPSITYRSDDRACAVSGVEDGVRVEAPEDGAQLAKAITVRRDPPGWIVDHVVRNVSQRSMTIAPWAITQLRTGGEAVLPSRTARRGTAGRPVARPVALHRPRGPAHPARSRRGARRRVWERAATEARRGAE